LIGRKGKKGAKKGLAAQVGAAQTIFLFRVPSTFEISSSTGIRGHRFARDR
jgi:hypothetical protein